MRFAATLIQLLCFGILSAVLFSCGAAPTSFKQDADKELNKLAGPNPDSVDKTMLSQAQAAETSGDFRQAAQMYMQLADRHPDKKEYTLSLADCQRRAGMNEAALKTIDTYLKKDPKSAEGLEIRGLTLMNIGELSEAGKTFDQVMNIDGNRWRTLNAIGILFAVKKLSHEAIPYYNAALKNNPDNPGILNNLGLALAMDKQYDASIAAFIHARNHLDSSNPELAQVDLNLAVVYALNGKLDEAEQVAAPHLSKAQLYNNMGVYAYIAKNKDLAKSYMDMALNQNPTYYERAWKNMNAINGDNASEGNAEDNPAGDLSRSNRLTIEEPGEQTLPTAKLPATSTTAAIPPASATVSPTEGALPSDKSLFDVDNTNKTAASIATPATTATAITTQPSASAQALLNASANANNTNKSSTTLQLMTPSTSVNIPASGSVSAVTAVPPAPATISPTVSAPESSASAVSSPPAPLATPAPAIFTGYVPGSPQAPAPSSNMPAPAAANAGQSNADTVKPGDSKSDTLFIAPLINTPAPSSSASATSAATAVPPSQ